MLHTPKDMTGPDGGLPAASFRAWWEAQHDAASWNDMFRVPRTDWMDYLNWFRRLMDLPGATKWAYAMHLRRIDQPPPQPTFDAAIALPGFRIATATPWDAMRRTGAEIVVEGEGMRQVFDRLVIGTGFMSDLPLCPEYAVLLPKIALWRGRFAPAPDAPAPDALNRGSPGSPIWAASVVSRKRCPARRPGSGGCSASAARPR